MIFYDWDLETNRMTWTGALEVLFERPDENLSCSHESWVGRIALDDIPIVEARLAQLVAGDIPRADLRYRLRRGDSEMTLHDRVFAVREHGEAQRLIGVVKPESAEQAQDAASLQDQLQHSETRFRTFIESLPLLAWETDGEGWIFYYNQRWYDYTGTTPEQMEGWGWVSVHDPDDLPRMLKVFRTALSTGQPWEDEFRLRRADGSFRWHLSRAMPFRDERGRIVRWFGTNTDIHDQKLALQERDGLLAFEQQLRQEAQRASQQKDEFLALVSHELRSPLNTVLGWAQMLRSDRIDESRRNNAIEKIEVNARFLGRLINDLLDVSRIITGKLAIDRAATDVPMAIDAAIDGIRATADAKHIALFHRRPAGPAIVMGSMERLQQVFTNLLSNAVKFSPQGSRILVTSASSAHFITVIVSDEGEGIEPAFLSKLFTKFAQADASNRRRHGGLGLGLAIVKHLVDLHGGSVVAHSEGRGRGASFTVTLPQQSAVPASDLLAAPKPTPIASLVGVKVLAVDDDPEARDVIASVLLSCGATVTVVGSVADALKTLRLELPDIVVSDISMPEVDGYGLLERLEESADPRVRALPVVALSAAASDQSRAQGLARGFASYLTKPLEMAVLSNTVLDVVRRRIVKTDE